MTEPCHAILIEAPDQPGYDELPWDESWDEERVRKERAALPARFHIPVWEDAGHPAMWGCAVCWGDGWQTRWPCQTASEHGGDIFAKGPELARYRAAWR